MSANHDPMCKKSWPDVAVPYCDCSLIARVRAEYVNPDCVWGQGECLPNCPSCRRMDDLYAEWCKGHERGYAEGVADERVKARKRVDAVVVQMRWGTTTHGLIGKGEAAAAAGGDAE